jgi:hypothetical protein
MAMLREANSEFRTGATPAAMLWFNLGPATYEDDAEGR